MSDAAQDHICGPDCQCGCEAGLTIPIPRTPSAAQDQELPTVERWMVAEIADELASALHYHNIGRDIRGWKEVSEAFDSIKAVLNGRY